ncbi:MULTISPECIES: ferritin-like protein [Streptomyces]|uniref:ferritin-like protein n=1 Tax=Streptomyces lycopersici TaxID=2974589 RepID=UPI0021CF3A02|nr:ferritin-like protein [Streptomyces sp. NEAU-383]
MENKDTPITTIQELKDHLQIALAVELATIPAYLSGWFTIRNRQTTEMSCTSSGASP